MKLSSTTVVTVLTASALVGFYLGTALTGGGDDAQVRVDSPRPARQEPFRRLGDDAPPSDLGDGAVAKHGIVHVPADGRSEQPRQPVLNKARLTAFQLGSKRKRWEQDSWEAEIVSTWEKSLQPFANVGVYLYKRTVLRSQAWEFRRLSSKGAATSVNIAHAVRGQCLEPVARGEARGLEPVKVLAGATHVVTLVTCDPSRTSQEWEFLLDESRPGGWGRLVHVGTGKCLRTPVYPEPSIAVLEPCSHHCEQVLALVAPPSKMTPPPLAQLQQHLDKRLQGMKGLPGQRVLCWILTQPKNHDKKAVVQQRTWAKWCDTLLYISSEPHPDLNVVTLKLSGPEGRSLLWEKTRKAWLYVYEHHLKDADWFIKADDDTFVVMDELKRYVRQFKPQDPHFFGKRFKLPNEDKIAYYSGGAGYVLSHEALRRIGGNASTVFQGDKSDAEDVEIARRLAKVGVYTTDTRDETGAQRFLPMELDPLRFTGTYTRQRNPDQFYFSMSYYPPKEGRECCSKHFITSHYTGPVRTQMYYNRHALRCLTGEYAL